MPKRLLRTTIISIGLLALLSSCGQTKAPAQQPPADPAMSKPQVPTSNPAPTPAPTAPVVDNKQLIIKTYYGNENGDMLIEQETTISYKQDDEKYMAALKALSINSDTTKLPLFKGFTFKKVAPQNGQLTVDVSMAPESRLGAGGEELLLKALKQTIFQFTEINSIELLLDGKAVESLMGHMELPHPIKR